MAGSTPLLNLASPCLKVSHLSYPPHTSSTLKQGCGRHFRRFFSSSLADMSSWLWLAILTLLPCITTPLTLNSDGALLLTFKSSILADPLSALHNWNSKEKTPCAWNGVICTNISTINNATANSRVTSLVLPNTKLVGFIPSSLFLIDHLQHLDLSNNFLNATLPISLLNASELRILSLANNEIFGNLPELAGGQLSSLQLLNLSNNALTGRVPTNLSLLPNLTVVSLANNYLSGSLAGGGYRTLKVLDISSNLINGSLPKDLGGSSLRYLNLSHNLLVGSIPLKMVSTNPFDTGLNLDLSFNNLTGEIPQLAVYLSQNSTSFTGNIDLCGRPLREQCAFLSELSDPASSELTAPTAFKSPPALAAIPRYPNGDALGERAAGGRAAGLRPAAIVAISVGDVGGIGLLLIVFFYVYKAKKKNKEISESQGCQTNTHEKQECLSCCLKKLSDSEESSESSASCEIARVSDASAASGVYFEDQHKHQEAILVTVDGGTELELESLLKASAYMLGATASSIVYKAVLADGTTLAVRRVGDGSTTDRLKDFEARVRSIAKLRHPNLLPIRGLYWGADEKLLIHHYASNGSLANIPFTKKTSSSPLHLSWACRLRIATGVARGLAYLHDRKSVHRNIKPSNILLAEDMEPWIGDFGLDRLIPMATKPGRQFSSQRSCKSLPDLSTASSSSSYCGSYQAPEALKSLKGNPKWDVYSFGVVLLELLAGRMFTETEMCRWNAGFVVEERGRVLRMADPALRAEVEGKEMDLLVCFKLGFACAAVAPQRRPSMADAVQVLDKISFSP